jgi:Lysozyme like domain/NlpC/P60 family
MSKARTHPYPARHARPRVHSPARPGMLAGVTVAGLVPLTAFAYPAGAPVHQAMPVHRDTLAAHPRHLTRAQRGYLHRRHVEHVEHMRYLAWLRAQRHPVVSGTRLDGDRDHDGDVSDGVTVAATGGVPSGTLGCSGLAQLWVDAGGNPADRVTAADVAMAESGGRQYATGQAGEEGYWQINPVNGSLATYNPLGNAKAAIVLSADGTNWSPWTTYTSGIYAGRCGAVTTAVTHHRVITHPRPRGSSTDLLALGWAETQAGKPYIYGGNGPYGYDCSGLVVAAYARLGIMLPRTTYDMLGSWHLVRVTVPREGDIAFYGSGHVEFFIRPGVTYGALNSGTRIGYHTYGGWWQPTEFFAVR